MTSIDIVCGGIGGAACKIMEGVLNEKTKRRTENGKIHAQANYFDDTDTVHCPDGCVLSDATGAR
jgi:hypothetical protein